MPTKREIEILPEAPASMPSPIPLRPPAVQDSPSAPTGKEMKVEENSEAVVQDEAKSSSSTPPAATGTDTDSTSSDDDDLLEYANIEHTRKNDVLCGRGVTTNRHPGNEKFRALVHANKVRGYFFLMPMFWSGREPIGNMRPLTHLSGNLSCTSHVVSTHNLNSPLFFLCILLLGLVLIYVHNTGTLRQFQQARQDGHLP